MKTLIAIPARYASTRYPGKPLVTLRGPDGEKTLIRRSWEAAMAVKGVDRVVVATDDARIADHATGFGAEVVMTSPACQNGTERCAEVAAALPIWGPMVAAWDELTAMYEEGERTGWKDKRDPMYHRIKELVDAGRLADGWENPSPGYWKKGRASDVEIGSGVSIRT